MHVVWDKGQLNRSVYSQAESLRWITQVSEQGTPTPTALGSRGRMQNSMHRCKLDANSLHPLLKGSAEFHS